MVIDTFLPLHTGRVFYHGAESAGTRCFLP